MGFKIGNIFKGKSKTYSTSTMVGLTETGKREITRYSSSGAGFDAVAPLDDHSPQSVGSLMRETGMTYDEIVPRLEVMERQRLIERFGQE